MDGKGTSEAVDETAMLGNEPDPLQGKPGQSSSSRLGKPKMAVGCRFPEVFFPAQMGRAQPICAFVSRNEL